MAELEKYKVVDYYDVWGNKKDGWEVNNLATIGEVELKDYTSIKEILTKLKEIDFLKKHVRANMVDVWNDYDMIEIYQKKDSRPVCRLERQF